MTHRTRQHDQARATALTRWFDAAQRDLPWRRHRDGYTALVAEAMLQQTQVSRVLERYEAFIARFPTVEALAAADEQAVLAAWRGLGYYRRARSLHAAARMIVRDFSGTVPATVGELSRLPGVGRYTAGAIASIVHGDPAPIVDGNVLRVLARWDARRQPATEPAMRSWAWERAGAIVAATDRPGVLNEAMMELGATICAPRNPRCLLCPVARWCRAHERGEADRIPPPKRAAERATIHHHAVLVRRNGHVLLEQRPATGLWSRMWQPPTVEADRPLDPDEVSADLGFNITRLSPCGGFEHQTTHRRVVFHLFAARTRIRRGVWRRPDDIDDLPMSNAHRRVLATLDGGS
jgi:A/G-specific adenine glycosylase